MSGSADWNRFSLRRSRLCLPLKPDADVARRFGEAIKGKDGTVLMLGLTPELSSLGQRLTVAEWNELMLEQAWPQERPDAQAAIVDWRKMQFAAGAFTAAIGDGSLTVIRWPGDYRDVFGRLSECLKPEGRIALRCFVAPDRAEEIGDIQKDVLAGREASFHALKWRIAMAVAAGRGGNVRVEDILAEFEKMFPNRSVLVEATTWSSGTIAEIDSYRGLNASYSFVTAKEIIETLPPSFKNPRFEPSGAYPLAERCPIFVADFAPD